MTKTSLKNTKSTTLVLFGRIPSKKNGKIMICRGSRPILISTPAYSAWREEQLWKLKGKKVPSIITELRLSFYAPDARRTDLTNKAESVMDLLVDARLIEDDNWTVIPKLVLEYIEIDRKNPRCVISFY